MPDWLPDRSGTGTLVHWRTDPVQHRFAYPLWMLCVDADRLSRQGLGHPAWLPVTLRASDLLDGNGDIRQAVDLRLQMAELDAAPGQILVVAQPRSFGVFFNPVVFYLCLDEAGCLTSVLADIHNTPWNERHVYVLPAAEPGRRQQFDFPKQFHVSPFAAMERDYRWTFELTEQTLRVQMALVNEAQTEFRATLHLSLAPLTRGTLLRAALSYPAQCTMTLARIYWQALRLFLKRTRFHPHPGGLRTP